MVLYPRINLAKAKGTAIVFALGITTLVVVLASAMIMSLRSDILMMEKLSTMTKIHRLIAASEAMALYTLSHDQDHEKKARSFELMLEGESMTGALIAMPSNRAVLDKKIPIKGVIAVLHTRIEGDLLVDVYSLFKKQNAEWQLMYRSHGARK